MAGGRADFEFLGELGRGSFSTVYKVRRRLDRRVCACKEVALSHFKTDREKAQALSEAQLMKSLSCPHIVGYLDAFVEQECLYIVLQLCERGSLSSYFQSVCALSEGTLWRIFLRIAFGLEYLHLRRIIHRDLKSQNVFLMGRDIVRIGDLGLAKSLNDLPGRESPRFCGTPRYLSPEEVSGTLTHYTEKTDTWALGILLYELCSDGHRGPFDEATTLPALVHSILHKQPPPLPERGSAALADVCEALLCKQPERRLGVAGLLALPCVGEFAEAHAVLGERSDPSAVREDGTPVGRAGDLCRRGGSKAGGEGCPEPAGAPGAQAPSPHSMALHSTGSFQRSEEVPDGLCARLCGMLGPPPGEGSFGPRFHRYGFCEMCAAQGSEADAHFSLLRRRHHCRACGRTVCNAHSLRRRLLPHYGHTGPQRICELCSFGSLRLLIIAAGQRAFAWDSCSLSHQAWAGAERLFWMGLASCGAGAARAGEVLCTIDSQPGAVLELRPLQRLGEAVPCPSVTKGRLMACSGPWLAALRNYRSGPLVRVEELPSGRCLGHCPAEGVTTLAVQSGRGGFLVTGAADGEVRVWRPPGLDEPCEACARLRGHTAAVTGIALGCGGSFVCTSSKDGTVRIWRREGEALAFGAPAVCQDHRATGSGALCCDGPLLAYVVPPRPGSWEQGATLWDLKAGRRQRSCYGRGHSVRCIALRGAVLATGSGTSGGCEVQLWHARTGMALYTIRNPAEVTRLLLAEADQGSS